ncbi:MAG: Uncharacterized protein FD135_1745 [Comamonadaceae bacterium]|nr:MAG: Uncharacterized protein FD135_1745 [Comamonadaceae bacterium]
MKSHKDIVYAVVNAAPGHKLASRVRLQKTVYLLKALGFDNSLQFQYYHFGPYSRELDIALTEADESKLVLESQAKRQSDGATYSLFEAQSSNKNVSFGKLTPQRAQELIAKFTTTNVTVLELAATAHWLKNAEKIADWRAEIVRRKGVKTENGRLERAIELLKELELAPS